MVVMDTVDCCAESTTAAGCFSDKYTHPAKAVTLSLLNPWRDCSFRADMYAQRNSVAHHSLVFCLCVCLLACLFVFSLFYFAFVSFCFFFCVLFLLIGCGGVCVFWGEGLLHI